MNRDRCTYSCQLSRDPLNVDHSRYDSVVLQTCVHACMHPITARNTYMLAKGGREREKIVGFFFHQHT
jgi:hypothetical protein